MAHQQLFTSRQQDSSSCQVKVQNGQCTPKAKGKYDTCQNCPKNEQ